MQNVLNDIVTVSCVVSCDCFVSGTNCMICHFRKYICFKKLTYFEA